MANTNEDGSERDPWDDVGNRFTELAQRIGNTYQDSGTTGPSEDEIRDALRTLGAAWESMTSSLANTLRDPEVRRDLSDAAGAMAEAVGESFGAFGRAVEKERQRNTAWSPHTDDFQADEEE